VIVLVVSRVTSALRGSLTRWLLEVHAGVFVGHVSPAVRDRLWAMVQGRRRLGACTLITRAATEQGFTIVTSGDPRRQVIDCDGLTLLRVAKRLSGRNGRPATAVNPTAEGCGGDPSARGPDEAAKLGGDAGHPERTVLPDEEVC
jgi:CRISPR-associated protein Cas2